MEVAVSVQKFETLCHEIRIFSAGDANADFVAGIDQFVLFDSCHKLRPNRITKSGGNA